MHVLLLIVFAFDIICHLFSPLLLRLANRRSFDDFKSRIFLLYISPGFWSVSPLLSIPR